MKTKLIHRIKEFIDFKGLTMRKFDLSIKASDGYTQRTIKNEGSVGSDILEKIIDTYPEINPYWLIAGEGEMLRKGGVLYTLEEEESSYEGDFFELALLKYLDKPRVKEKIKTMLRNEEGEKVT